MKACVIYLCTNFDGYDPRRVLKQCSWRFLPSRWWFREVEIGLVGSVLAKWMPSTCLLTKPNTIMVEWPSASLFGTFSVYIKRQRNLCVHQGHSLGCLTLVGKGTPLQAHQPFSTLRNNVLDLTVAENIWALGLKLWIFNHSLSC